MRAIAFMIFAIILFGINYADAFYADITIDGTFGDWDAIKGYPDDEGDTFGGPEDDTMDILSYKIANDEDFLYIMVVVKDNISKGTTSRGAYQTIVDSDNDYNTGIQSDKEAPYPPHEGPIGVDRYISVETKTGLLQGIGMAGFTDDANEIGGPGEFEVPDAVCSVEVVDNQYELSADLESLDIDMESEIKIAILHYSASDTVDWTMPALTYLVTMDELKKVDEYGKSISLWGRIKNTYNP